MAFVSIARKPSSEPLARPTLSHKEEKENRGLQRRCVKAVAPQEGEDFKRSKLNQNLMVDTAGAVHP